jgi:LmbE family N-acetylglucosaminyl deacetylase
MTLNLNAATLIVISPHPDDEVINCGGLIRRIKDAGGAVYVLYLTVGTSEDFGAGGVSDAEHRIAEIEKVVDFLKIDGWRLAFAGDDYHLKLDTVPQRRLIHEIERGDDISFEALRPDIVAFPSFADYNQDHRAAAMATFAACRPAPEADKHIPGIILSGESPMEGWSYPFGKLQPNMYVKLSREQAQDKVKAMQLYSSQLRAAGHPRHVGTLLALAQVRGSTIGASYAEAYVGHKLTV